MVNGNACAHLQTALLLDHAVLHVFHNCLQNSEIAPQLSSGQRPHGGEHEVETGSLQEEGLRQRWVQLQVRLGGDPVAPGSQEGDNLVGGGGEGRGGVHLVGVAVRLLLQLLSERC